MYKRRQSTLVDLTERYIVPYVFRFSDQPMLFQELMKANRTYVQGHNLENSVSGFRLSTSRTYLVFGIAWNIIILFISLIFHFILVKLDCHLLIILSVVFTVLFFSSFAMFKSILLELVTKKMIKQGWALHFPHFDFEKHHGEVSQYYSQALEEDIKAKDLQLYIINKLVAQ